MLSPSRALALLLIRGTPIPRQLADDPLITYVTHVDNVLLFSFTVFHGRGFSSGTNALQQAIP